MCTCVQTCVAVHVCAKAHSHVCSIKSQGIINSGYLKFYKCICFLSSFFIFFLQDLVSCILA